MMLSHDEDDNIKLSPNKDLSIFQQQVLDIISDVSEPPVNDKLEVVTKNINARSGDAELPLNINTDTTEDAKKCLQKLNELYLQWKEKGCDNMMLNTEIRKDIYLCLYEYVGATREELNRLSKKFDAMYSCEDVNTHRYHSGKNCHCNIQ